MSHLDPRRDAAVAAGPGRSSPGNHGRARDNEDDDGRSTAASSSSSDESSVIFVRCNASPNKAPPPPPATGGAAPPAGPPTSIVVPAAAIKKKETNPSSCSSFSSSSTTAAPRSNDSNSSMPSGQQLPVPNRPEGAGIAAHPPKALDSSGAEDPHQHHKSRAVSADESQPQSGGSDTKIDPGAVIAETMGPRSNGDGGAPVAVADPNAGATEAPNRKNAEEESLPDHGSEKVLFACWRCHTEITYPYHAVHKHPALAVPACHCCHEELEAILEKHRNESNKESQESDDSNDTSGYVACFGCGPTLDEVVFLCDACPNQFCAACVVRASVVDLDDDDNDNDERHAAIVEAVQALDPWHCLSCKPSPFLRDLQDRLRAHVDDDEDGDVGDKHKLTEAELQRKHDTWSQELVECEDEMARVLQELDRRDSEAGPDGSRQARRHEDDDDVRDEDEERHGLERHYSCLRHKISRLQENLEDVCNVDLALWYRRVMGITMPAVDDDAVPPEEVVAADRAIRQRKAREDKERLANLRNAAPMSLAALLDDEYHGVEDLDDDDDEEEGEGLGRNAQPHRNVAVADPSLGWRSSYEMPNPELIRHLRQKEDALLEARNIPVRRVTERSDRQATRIEDRAEKRGRRKHVGLVAAVPPVPEAEAQNPDASSLSSNGKAVPPLIAAVPDQEARPTGGSAEEEQVPTASPQKNGLSASEPVGSPGTSTMTRTRAPDGTTAPRTEGTQPTGEKENASILETPVSLKGYGAARLQENSVVGEGVAESGALVLNPGAERVVAVSREIATKLKDHQKEGVKFIWNNSFSDLNRNNPSRDEEGKIHGCLLAHNMGLGKSLTAIAVLHTVLNHPNLRGCLKSAIIVAPVNTLTNWEDEIEKWTENVKPRLIVENLAGKEEYVRVKAVDRWRSRGGILLLGEQLFLSMQGRGTRGADKRLLETDVLVLDEAHTMLKNSNNKVFKALSSVKTMRRILLTGTPLQNNVTEYFRMIQFAKPGAIDGIMNEAEFERTYRIPIERGLPSNVSIALREASVRQQVRLRKVLEPLVHRRGASLLLKSVGPMQQSVLYLRPTREQTRLCKTYKRLQDSDPKLKNFFRMWKDTKRVHNHPGVLAMPATSSGSRPTSPSPDDDDEERSDSLWWEPYVKDREKLNDVENGYKVVVLLHILCHASTLGDKVLVFSSCLRTLDFIESVVNRPNWSSFVATLQDDAIGGFVKNEDYVRIDGTVGSGERGVRVTQFNDIEKARLFLISSRAGGIGINLTAANRVVLFDSDFNPTIATQCVFRAFRYGQKKPVYCYRLLTEGMMEQKIYARSVTKQGVCNRVIDGHESLIRCFTAQELEDMQQDVFWVQCDRCEKWRVPLNPTEVELREKWFCEMNDDVENNSCSHEERSQKWYEDRAYRASVDSASSDPAGISNEGEEMPEHVKRELVRKDEILQRILSIKTSKKSTAIVSRYEFHEMLLDPDEAAQRALPTDPAPLPDTAASAGATTVKAVPAKQSPSTATPTKVRTTDSPSKAPGDRESPKREAPPVRTPPARIAKQAKTAKQVESALSLPPGQRQLNFAPTAATKSTASSREAASNAREATEPPRKKHPRLSSASGASHRSKALEGSTEVVAKSKRRTRPAASVPAPIAPEQEVIDLCDSD